MMPTKEQWAEIEKSLSGYFGRVELRCDGYNVIASIERVAHLKEGIVVYVNGCWKGEWYDGKADEARKFHREMRRFLYPARQREEARKKLKSRRLHASLRDWYTGVAERSISTWAPYWTNAKAFTRHLRKTCADIELVSIGHKV
jgi:hypothetical protein